MTGQEKGFGENCHVVPIEIPREIHYPAHSHREEESNNQWLQHNGIRYLSAITITTMKNIRKCSAMCS